MRNYIKLLFVLMLTVSAGLFLYSGYALFAGRAMEKEYTNLQKDFNTQANNSRNALMNVYITDYELKFLAGKHNSGLSVGKVCYTLEDSKKTQEQNKATADYNAECKAKSIPESTVRPEVDEIYKGWVDARGPIEAKQKDINSRIYADNSGKGKLDLDIINRMAIFAGGGILFSAVILLLLYRVPVEEQRKAPKQKESEQK